MPCRAHRMLYSTTVNVMVRSDGITTQQAKISPCLHPSPPAGAVETPNGAHSRDQENGSFFGGNPPPTAATRNTPSSQGVIVENSISFRARYAIDIRAVALCSLCLVVLTQPNAGMVFTAHQIHRRRTVDVEVSVRNAPKK